jgi:superfamily I DNA and RNA helicase
MLEIVRGRNKKNMLAQSELNNVMKNADLTGTLYFGYPIIATADQMVTVDALLTSREHGVVAINFYGDESTSPELIEETEDDVYTAVYRKLLEYKPLVRKRDLLVKVNTLTFGPNEMDFEESDVIVTGPNTILERLESYSAISDEELMRVNSAIQRVTTLKPPAKRDNVRTPGSKGSVLSQIEKQIANLDQWQKRAAIECPDGPQRVRGLAGSGKTIVLALKAAYLHSANPEWNIAITFNTRALYQQFTDLVRRFCFEHTNNEPDWTKLRILHAWGSGRQAGIYSEIATANDLPIKDFSTAKSMYGAERAFGGVCDEMLSSLKEKGTPVTLFDAVLIDEGQDLPQSFFELCYLSAKDPKRVVWAYDELQNLGSYSMVPPSESSGKTVRVSRMSPILTVRTALRDVTSFYPFAIGIRRGV